MCVRDIIVGSEALAAGVVTRHILRTKYVKLHHNVYARAGMHLDARHRAMAAYLWSRGKATLVGHSAAALHGTKWLSDDAPAELAYRNLPAPPGIVIHRSALADDEVCVRASIDCTTPARTAYDIGRRTEGDASIVRIDSLLNATGCPVADVEQIAARYPGARGIRQLRAALDLADGGAESPQETRLRLLLVRSGFPRPVTQIPVANARGRRRRIDMGWPEWMVGAEYDGEQHWTNPDVHAEDIERLEFLAAQGWTIIRVSARHLRFDRAGIIARVSRALAQYL
jgi:hypothetical protein